LCVHPSAAVNLDEAHQAIEQWEHYSHKPLDDAQRLAVEHMMAIRADGTWAARTTGRAEPRQNGKGDELEVVEAWDLTRRGAPVMHTAHEIPTARSAHARLVGHLQSHRDLRKLIKQTRNSSMDLSIEMVNGGVVRYRTRTAGGGRGLDDIARLIVDEAQHVTPDQLAASMPIVAVNPNPQTNFTGSAGIEGRSGHWWGLRKRAMQGDGGDFAWLEHTAEEVALADGQVVSIPPNPADVDAWIKANPAFPARIPPGFLAEQLKVLGPALFAREYLCVWDPMPGELPSPFGAGKWEACATGPRPDGLRPGALGVAASYELKHGAIVAAATSGPDVFVKPLRHGPGIQWLVAAARELQDEHGVDVVIDGHGPAAEKIPALKDAGVRLQITGTAEVLDACAGIFDLVQDRLLHHGGDVELDRAVGAAVKRPVGDRWAWGRRQSEADISTLEAVTLAVWWAVASQRILPAIY
jgi:hypothetical protein